jgi:hypothetical protein
VHRTREALEELPLLGELGDRDAQERPADLVGLVEEAPFRPALHGSTMSFGLS